MKKLLLSSAIAATMGMASFAHAAVDLDKPNGENPIVFAEEIAIGTGVVLDVTAAGGNGAGESATAAAAEGAFDFTIGDGTSKYVRLTFSQPLAAALVPGDFDSDNTNATFSISQAGQEGDTYVIVEVAANGGDVLATDHFVFQPAVGAINATDMSTRTLSYDLYETAVDSVGENNVLASKSAQWITWGPGYEVSCTAGNPQRIDVVTPEDFLDGTNSTDVATATVDELDVYTEDGVQVDIVTDYFSEGSTITIAGSTAAFTAADGFNLDGTDPDAAPADGDAEWTTVTAAPGVVLPLDGVFDVTSNGADAMVPSAYTLSIVDDGDANYDVGTVSDACGDLQYSGSTDRLDFALTPGGAFKQWARITNPSGTPGDVTVTVYNDAGSSVTFPLGDIDGVDSSIEAHGSTKLVDINDVYAAAQAADSSFELSETSGTGQLRNKLRVEVRGEFGDDAYEESNVGNRLVGRAADGIYIQAVTLSNDGESFFQTK